MSACECGADFTAYQVSEYGPWLCVDCYEEWLEEDFAEMDKLAK